MQWLKHALVSTIKDAKSRHLATLFGRPLRKVNKTDADGFVKFIESAIFFVVHFANLRQSDPNVEDISFNEPTADVRRQQA